MHMKRFAALFLALSLFCPLWASAQEPLKKLVIAEPVHLTGYLPLYIAMHKGYFEEQGLKVSVVQATGGAHVTAVVSGDAWGVIGGVDSSALGSQGSPDPIVGVVNCVNRANVYLFAAKGLAPASQSDEDLKAFLKGKTIVAGRYGGSPNLLTRYLLMKVGLDPDKDVTLLENADASTVNALIQMGQGQIGNGGEPQISDGIAAGIWEEPFYKFPDLGDFSYSVVGVKKSTIDKDPETVQKFVNAMLKALKVVHENPDIAREVLDIEFSTMTEAGKEASLKRAYEDHLWSQDGWISQEAVELDMDVLIQSGIYQGTYDYNELVDMQFVQKGVIKE
ncbi:MAG: ABC transporter substrate-binding protein [Clostridia bacterium]|nr:ABC transporter substrate-binding protein [Clostridia bacterium]